MDAATLTNHFESQGFTSIDVITYEQLTIAPNLVFERDSVVKAIVIRESNDSLPDSLIQRFSMSKRIPSKTLELYFSFPSKPSMKILAACKDFAVGILYPDANGNVQTYAEPKQIKGRRAIAAIPKTQIFFSSRQDLPERVEGNTIINDNRESLKVPIFSMLVENDQHYSHDIRKLWPVICRCMDECRYILVILSGDYRKIIDRETRRALEYWDADDILFYVKNDRHTKEQWNDLLVHASNEGVKYTEFFDLRDFKLKFSARTMKIIMLLHDEFNVPFLAEDP